MAALNGENNGQDDSSATAQEPQPMEIVDAKPARTRKASVKKGKKTAEAAQIPVKEEEQMEGTEHLEQQDAGAPNGTSIAPDDEGKNVDPSDQASATASTRPSAECAQPKASKSKAKLQFETKTPAVIETPQINEVEEELDLNTPYIPKDLRAELFVQLSGAGRRHPDGWDVPSPFDAAPEPQGNPPMPDSALVVGLPDREVLRLRQLLRFWTSKEYGSTSRKATKFFHRLDYTYKAESFPEALVRHDRILAMTLERLSREIPFEVFFCRLERGFEDTHSDPRYEYPSYVLEGLFDLQSRSYAKFMPVDDNDWTTTKTYGHRKPQLLPGHCDTVHTSQPHKWFKSLC